MKNFDNDGGYENRAIVCPESVAAVHPQLDQFDLSMFFAQLFSSTRIFNAMLQINSLSSSPKEV